MLIDHIFIVSENKGKEADNLLEAGFKEAPGRRHPGQGTINRKFYFGDFLLEFLWVCDKTESEHQKMKECGLWHRLNYRETGFSPFGICFLNNEQTDHLFQNSTPYQPDYFPKGMIIETIPGFETPTYPWLFRLPYRNVSTKKNQIDPSFLNKEVISSITFQWSKPPSLPSSSPLNIVEPMLSFSSEISASLLLELNNQEKGKSLHLAELNIEIRY